MEYKCPARLKVKIKDSKITLFGQSAMGCVTYQKSIPGPVPSGEYCPTCPYNTRNIRKAADQESDMRIHDFLVRNGAR